MRILEDENLLENTVAMGEYLLDQLEVLKAKHPIIGDIRGKGLFVGAELVSDRESREPVHESIAQAIVAECFKRDAVMIGATNRSIAGFNNTLCLSPALICTKSDLDEVVSSIDGAITRVLAA